MKRQEATARVYGNPEAAFDLMVELAEVVPSLQAKVADLERKIVLLTP